MDRQDLFKEFEEKGMPVPDSYFDIDEDGKMIIVEREEK